MKESQRVIQSDGSGELRRSAADRLPRHNHTIAKEIDEETTHPHPQRIAPPARTDQAKMFNHDNHKHATRVRSSARASPTPGSTTRRRARHEQQQWTSVLLATFRRTKLHWRLMFPFIAPESKSQPEPVVEKSTKYPQTNHASTNVTN